MVQYASGAGPAGAAGRGRAAVITSGQIRAARGFLRWSARELAERSGLDPDAVRRIEAADGVPDGSAGDLAALRQALEAAGVAFRGETGVDWQAVAPPQSAAIAHGPAPSPDPYSRVRDLDRDGTVEPGAAPGAALDHDESLA